jgi:polysaccharide pyruvyl transferase WcaK-like protein
MPKVLIWKNKIWESQGSNTGDMAIIAAMIDDLTAAIPGVEITILSDNPDVCSQTYGVNARQLWSLKGPWNVIRTVRESDLVVLGGGTILTDETSLPIIPINLSLGILAKLLGRKVMCYAVGVGGLSAFGRWQLRTFVNRFDLLTLRDIESKEALDQIGVNKVRKVVTADAAFSLRGIPPEQAHKLMAAEGIPSPSASPTLRTVSGSKTRRPLIGISPRRIYHYTHSPLPFAVRRRFGMLPPDYDEKIGHLKRVMASAADWAVRELDADVVFLPMYSGGGVQEGVGGRLKRFFASRDDVIATEIMNLMEEQEHAHILGDVYRPKELKGIISEIDLLIGIPLHSLILASSAGVPVVGLCYLPKNPRFMKMIGQEALCIDVQESAEPLDFEELIEKISRAWTQRNEISHEIESRLTDIIHDARSNAEYAAELMASND